METLDQRLDRLIPIDSTFKGRNFDATVVSVGRLAIDPDLCTVVLKEHGGKDHFLYFDLAFGSAPPYLKVGTRWRCGYNKYGTLNYTVPPSSNVNGVSE